MKRFSKQLFSIFVIIIIVKIVEAIQRLVISYKFGISDVADIYWALITIPDYIIVITGFSTLNGVVNSQYSSLYANEDFDSMRTSFSNLFSILFIAGIIVLSFVLLFNRQFAGLILPGFSGEKFLVVVTFSAVLFPIFFFKSFSVFFSTVLNSYKIFNFPALIQLLLPLMVLISVFLPYYNGQLIYNLSYSNLLGSVITMLVLFIYLFKPVKKIRFTFFKFDDTTKKILKGCGVTFLPVLFQQFYILSKNFFASYLGGGAISSLYYAGFISGIISIVVFMSTFNLLLNYLSNSFQTEKLISTRTFFLRSVLTFLSLVVPVIIVFVLFNREIVSIIYLRGNFTGEDVSKTMIPFFWESLSLLNYLIYITFTALYLARKKYKMLSYIGIPVFLAGSALNFLLSRVFGYYGISIANFIITFVYAALLVWFSRPFIGRLGELFSKLFRVCGSALIVVAVFFVLKNVAGIRIPLQNQFLSDLVNTAVYSLLVFASYNYIAHLMKVGYLKELKSFIGLNK